MDAVSLIKMKKASRATKLHVVCPNQYLYYIIREQQYMLVENFLEVIMLVLQNFAQNIYMFANYLTLLWINIRDAMELAPSKALILGDRRAIPQTNIAQQQFTKMWLQLSDYLYLPKQSHPNCLPAKAITSNVYGDYPSTYPTNSWQWQTPFCHMYHP